MQRWAQGLVVAAQRRHYEVALDDGDGIECVLKGRTTRRSRAAIASKSRTRRTAASIEAVAPRSEARLPFRRVQAKSCIAANVTQIVGVVAPDVGVD